MPLLSLFPENPKLVIYFLIVFDNKAKAEKVSKLDFQRVKCKNETSLLTLLTFLLFFLNIISRNYLSFEVSEKKEFKLFLTH